MDNLFLALLLISLILTIKPQWVFKSGKINRKHTGIAAAVFLVLFGIFTPKEEAKPLAKSTATPSPVVAVSPVTSPSVAPAVVPAATVAPSAKPSPAATVEGRSKVKITKVVDGDTMDISLNDKKETVRLLLVDTPETVHPDKPIQPFGPEASSFAKETLNGKEVEIEKDVSERDKYGRLLVYMWIGDKMFNEMLLEKGLARVGYVYPPDVKHVDRFREVQKKAQQAGIGIWSIENYASEDGFDESKAKPSAAPTKQPVATKAPAATAAPTKAPQSNVYYKNCTAVREAGAAPIYRGEPGYGKHLDRDDDGIACEK